MNRLVPFFLFLGSLLGLTTTQAQNTIAQESFESASPPSGSGTNSFGYSTFTSNTFDLRPNGVPAQYFVRSQQPVTGFHSGTTAPIIAGMDGSWLWASEGVRGQVGESPDRPAGYVQLNGISISGKSNVQVKVLFADSRGQNSGATIGGGIYQWENNDFVRVKARVDGGAWQLVGQFTGDNTNPSNSTTGQLRQDTNLNGSSSDNLSAPVLGVPFQDFTFTVSGTGSALDVMVEVDANGGSEELAFDNIRVLATQATTAAPVLANIESTNINYNEGDAARQITSTLTVSDADSPALTGGSVSLTTGFVSAQDQLLFINQNGISGSYNTSSGVLTLSGTATLATYQAALRSVRYQNIETVTAIGGLRVANFSLTDGSTASNTVSRNIIVTAQLNAPAALPYLEDFETNGEGLRYATDTWSTSNPCLGFLRTNLNPYPCTPVTFGNISNAYYWYSEGTSNGANPNPVDIGTMTLAPVNAASYNNLHVNIRLGTGQSAQWEIDDFAKFYYRINGGAWVLFGAFYGNGPTTATSGELQRDTNLDGVADGVILNSTLQNVDLALPPAVTGASVDFQILINSDGQEELAFDRINITGTQVVVPSVTTGMVSNLTTTRATVASTVNADGGAALSSYGLVYVQGTGTPTTANTVMQVGTNSPGSFPATFTTNLTSLLPSTAYTARAYATNSVGTSYGVNVTFTTPAPVGGTTVVTNVSCFGGSNGTINLTPRGGVAPYTFAWNTGATTEDRTGLTAGSYSVTITDATGATGAVNNIMVTQPLAIAASTAQTDVTMNGGNNGSATITVSGGTPSYTYSWSPNVSTTATAANLSAGSYTVTATDANGCTISRTFTITQPAAALTATVSTISASPTSTSPIPFAVTFSQSVGTTFTASDVTVSGGTVANGTFSGSGSGPYTFTVIPAGVGTVTVSLAANVANDANNTGNAVSNAVSVQFQAPTITIAPVSLPAGTQGTAYSVAFTASGGSGSYTYAITSGALPSGMSLSGNTISGTPMVSGTFNFRITATDASAAPGPYSGFRDYSLTIAPQPQTAAPIVTTPANGALINTTTPTYTGTAAATSTVTVYVDDNSIGTTTATGGGTWSLAQQTALTQGNHQVRATAQLSGQAVSGSSNTNTFTVDTVAPTVVITSTAGATGGNTSTSPIPFTVTFSEPVTGFVDTDMTVSGGAVANFAGSGTSYTFDVTPSANGLITVEVAANVAQDQANNGNTAASPFGVTYTRPVTASPVVVTPADGSLITSTRPTYTGTATALSSVTVVVDGNLNGGISTAANALGNWTLAQPTELSQGAHTVQARAQLSGQTASAYSLVNSFTVVVPATVTTATPTAVNNSGAILGGNVSDAGAGTVSERGVVYVVGTGTPTTSDTKVIIGAGTGSFAQAVPNLTPSTTYSVRAYAINQAGTRYGLTQTFSTGSSLSIGSVTPSAVCAGATISTVYTNSSPGTPLQLYLNGPSTTNLLLATLVSSQGSGAITATVPADRVTGQYSVYISGAGTTSGSVTFTVNAIPPAPTVSSPIIYYQNSSPSPLTATGISGASLNWYGTNATGGTPTSDAPTPVVTTSSTTNYYVSQILNGCESVRAVISVVVRPLPNAPATTPVTVCQNTTPISLATGVTASSGASLNWYTAATTGMASASAPVPPTSAVGQSIYYVSQSVNGCESPRAAIPFTVNALPVATMSNDGPLSCAKPTVTLTAGGAAGVPGTSYRFSSGASQVGNSNLATVSMSGPYSVTVTDSNGCSATNQTTVGSDLDNPQASLTNDGPLTCAKTTVTLTAGGAGTYRFSPGATQSGTSNLATVTTDGIYSVTVTSANGCSATAQTTVEVNTTVAAPTLTASALSTENAPISVTASGCNGTLTWIATGGAGTANGSVYTITQVGNYALTATCTVGTCTSPAAPLLALQIRPGGFAISSVDLIRCQLLDAGRGQYEISLTPQYSGLSGAAVSFGVTNELAATTAPGPYTLRLYIDNATITLAATQANAQVSYRYNWLAACNGTQPAPNRPPVAQPIPNQVLVVGQPYQLDLTNYFSDPDGQALTFIATGLPAGLQLSGSRISGSPTQAGSSTVQVTALDPGGLQVVGSVILRVDPAPTTPTPGVFSIAGVTGVRCETLSVGERRLSFSPVYTGLTGTPVSFGITNELAMTTAPGPYSLRLYTDNAVITLQATQDGTPVSYRYNWLAACATSPTTPPTGNRPPTVGTGLANQTAQVGQGFTLFIPAGTFVDPDNDQLQLRVSGLPAGLNFSAAQNAITGTPVQAGTSTVQVTATDPGGLSTSTSFVLTVQPAATTPTPGVFSIAGVTGVRCETLSAGERRLSFSPVYTGLTGTPVSFGITNELAMTTAPGPYSLRLYTDNPAITLQATQGSTPVSYRFEWLAACATSPNGRQAVAEADSRLAVVVLGNPVVGESVEIAVRGVEGQSVELILTDVAGNRLYQQRLVWVGADERVVIPVPTRQAITILKVNTVNQHQTVKLIRQ